MDVRLGFAEVDAQSTLDVRVGFVELDCLATIDVRFGFVEFDTLAPAQASPGDNESLEAGPVSGGRGRSARAASSAKNFAQAMPEPAPSRYHEYEADALAAAELDDEETILVLLMEIYADAL